MSLRDFVERVTTALDSAGVPYMVCGSVASTFHSRPRTTQDVDIVVEVDDDRLRTLLARFPEDAYYVSEDAAREALRRRSMFNIIDLATGWKADLIVRKSNDFAETEFSRRRAVDFLGIPVSMASAEDCIVSKLRWSIVSQSDRQLEDVRWLVESCGANLDRDYIESWVTRLGLDNAWKKATTPGEQ